MPRNRTSRSAVAVVCVAALAAAGAGCGGSGNGSAAQERVADRYSQEVAEGARRPTPVAAERPIPVKDFRAPIAAYRRYAAAQLAQMQTPVAQLRDALRQDDRAGAQAAWRTAFADYLRLGAVYGEFGAQDQAIDGLPGGLPGGTRDPHFTGLHRLELGLWGGEPTAALVPVADRLAADVDRLRHSVPTVSLPTLDYATRAHEILEDAQRDFLSGAQVPWSHEGVLATAAGVAATREVLATLQPILDGDIDNEVQAGILRLQRALEGVRRDHGGTYPTDDGLTQAERERLAGALGGSLESLQDVPGALETVVPPPTPRIPSR